MQELGIAVGLVLVIEGLLWAIFPNYGVKMLELLSRMTESNLRVSGAIAVALGVVVVWVFKG